MRAFIFSAFALFLMGCSHPGGARATGSHTAACRVVETVYLSGPAICGEVTVSPDGQFSRTSYGIWEIPVRTNTYSGRLPTAILNKLLASRASFRAQNGVPVYYVSIDDSKTVHPDGIDALRRYLWKQDWRQK